MRTRTRARTTWLRAGVHALALAPLLALAWRWLGPGLGADPVGWIIRRSGDVALTFLLLSLVPGAVRAVTGSAGLLAVRRALGLYAFAYAGLHLLSYVALGYGLRLGLLIAGLGQNRFVLVGLATFLVLTPLAITSSARWQRRLGRRWQQLHRAAYLAAALAVWHLAWTSKEWRVAPFIIGAVVVALLAARAPLVARAWRRWRGQGGSLGGDGTEVARNPRERRAY